MYGRCHYSRFFPPVPGPAHHPWYNQSRLANAVDVVVVQIWSSSYHEATVALQGREEAVAAQAEAIETNLTLLGATAVEDRLQEGVPQAISTLSAAGIKVCNQNVTNDIW